MRRPIFVTFVTCRHGPCTVTLERYFRCFANLPEARILAISYGTADTFRTYRT